MTRRWTSVGLTLVGLLLLQASCGGSPPPKRGVIERDLGAWRFRRYQQVLDIEVWVPKNKAVAHTASYVHKEALKRGQVTDQDVVNVFVTVYSHERGILSRLALFTRRLAKDGGYVVEEAKVRGVRLIRVGGQGEAWVLWAGKQYLIKVGGRGLDEVPKSVISKYGERYPSRVRPGILEGPPTDLKSPESGTTTPD